MCFCFKWCQRHQLEIYPVIIGTVQILLPRINVFYLQEKYLVSFVAAQS